MKAITIVIGRSVAGKAMEPRDWGRFQYRTIGTVANQGTYFRIISGVGQMNGSIEENATILGEIPEGLVGNTFNMLAALAREFNQDGILVIVGHAEYIEATT